MDLGIDESGHTLRNTCNSRIEAHLDGLGIKCKTLLLVDEELLDVLPLIALQLDHLSHFGVDDNGAIAGELLLDDLEDLLLIELLGQTLDSRQSLTTIAFYSESCHKLALL